MSRIFVKPAREGLKVRHPEKLSHHIPAEGEWVNESTEWHNYLRHGDVVLADGPNESQSTGKTVEVAKVEKVDVKQSKGND